MKYSPRNIPMTESEPSERSFLRLGAGKKRFRCIIEKYTIFSEDLLVYACRSRTLRIRDALRTAGLLMNRRAKWARRFRFQSVNGGR